MRVSFVMTLWLMVTVGVAGAWDIYAITFLPAEDTISYQLWDWGSKFPVVFLLLGILLGHILFPLRLPARQ